MKIKFTSINHKLIASLTAITLMVGTTGVAHHVETYKSRFVYKKDDQGKYVASNTIESMYLNKYYVAITKSDDKDNISIVREEIEPLTWKCTYYDAFSNNNIIYQEEDDKSANTECRTMPLTEFILYYDGIIKEEYTSEELEDIYAKITNDFEVDTNANKLVLSK